MTLTSRRSRPLDRTIPHLRDTRLIIIATEGERTEKQYFDIFARKSTRVQIKVLETEDGESAPKHVLRRLKQYRADYQLGKSDELWLVIDKDRWPDEQLSQIAAESNRSHFGLAVSRPCFEVWLYLHHSDPPAEMYGMSSNQVEDALRTLLSGYNPSNLRVDQFEPRIGEAIQRARALDTSPAARWPNQLGTRVYLVILSIKTKI